MKSKRVVWVLINISHYHEARWAAFTQNSNYDAIIIEIANQDAAFAELENQTSQRINRITLFPGCNWQQISGKERKRKIWDILNKLDPDVVCVNGWSIGGTFASASWALKKNRRFLIMSESNSFDTDRKFFLESVKSRFVKLASSALVGGKLAKDYIINLGMPSNQVFVGYDVVENKHFSHSSDVEIDAISKMPNGHFFIAVARLDQKKNHIFLLESYALYRKKVGDSAWPLVLLGDGELRPILESKVAALGLMEYFLMPGFQSYCSLPSWYHSAGCFIHPSSTEQWGLVVNEAMAAGLPVLVSNRCGCSPDLIRQGVNGFTFSPNNIEGLSDLMAKITSKDVNLKSMSKSSKEIIGDWSPNIFSKNLQKAIQGALKSPPSRVGFLDKVMLEILSFR